LCYWRLLEKTNKKVEREKNLWCTTREGKGPKEECLFVYATHDVT